MTTFDLKMSAVGTVTPAEPLEQQAVEADADTSPQPQADVTLLDPADDEPS